jgi:hypothetical protein
MAFESNKTITLLPVVANVINRFRFVSILAAGLVDETVANADAVGVSQEDSLAAASVAIPVMLLDGGKIEVEAGAAVTAGARIMSDATGRCIDATGATARVLGFALNATSAAGEVVTIVSLKAAGEFVA